MPVASWLQAEQCCALGKGALGMQSGLPNPTPQQKAPATGTGHRAT